MPTGSLTDKLRETLSLFGGSGEPLTTPEVADRLDLGRRSTYGRLERLVERDELETKKVGASARVWWRPSTTSTGEGATADGPERVSDDDAVQFGLLVDAVEEYAIFTLDPDGHVESWNEGARTIKGYSGDEIVGEHFSTFYTPDDRAAGVPEQNLAAAVDCGTVKDEGWRVRGDGSRFWADVTITAVHDERGELHGFAKVTRDMTERREQERQLRRERDLVERVFETSPVGLGVLSRDGLERANDRAGEIYGSSADDIDDYVVGEPTVLDADGEPVPPEERPNARVLATGESVTGWECQLERADGRRRWLSVSAAPLRAWDDGDVDRVVVATEDITNLKEQARRLGRQRDELEAELVDVFERIDDAFCALDDGFCFTYVNERAEELLRTHAGELLGECIWEVYPEWIGTAVWDGFHGAMATQEATEFEGYAEELDRWLEASVHPSDSGLSVYFRDVTARKDREEELERYETIVETVDDGVYVVDPDGHLTMVNDGYAELTGYPREALVGMHVSELVDEGTVERARAYERELADGEREMARFEADVLTAEGGAVRAEGSFSLIESHDNDHERVGVIRDITERKRRERQLELQRERLAALDDLNRVVRELTDAVVDRSTRAKIERTVCEHLAASDSYLFAWVGEVDTQTETLCLRTKSGAGDYLDGVAISADPNDPRQEDPFRRAVQTHEVQVVDDVLDGDDYARWREHARQHGVRSSASVPIVYEGVLFGVLNVYADRPYAFSGDEREIVDHLGEVVGHAIAAAEQRRALTSDEVVELDFGIPDVFDGSGRPRVDGRLTFDHAVPVGDDVYLEYGTATPGMLDVLDAIVETVPHWEAVRLVGEVTDEGPTRFELRLADPPVLSIVTALGGYVDRAVIEDGDFTMRIHLAPSVEVRRVVDVVQETYPMAQLHSRRQVTRNPESARDISPVFAERLTDRQRAALETAYFAGYFEWPRPVSGEELADKLGVSAPTFHQHLRKAQRTVLESALDDVTAA